MIEGLMELNLLETGVAHLLIVHVEDLDLGENIEIPHEVDFTIITISAPTAEEVEVDEDEDLLEEGEEAEGDDAAETASADADADASKE